jgi:hypothetical protein
LVLRLQALITKADVRWEPSEIIGYPIEAPEVFVTEITDLAILEPRLSGWLRKEAS